MHKKTKIIIKDLESTIEKVYNTTKDEKRILLYLDWLMKQNNFFRGELEELHIPSKTFPRKIDEFKYSMIKNKDIFNLYYYKNGENKYIRNSVKITNGDRRLLVDDLILFKGRIVWVELGFNVGKEFGGERPVIILKNIGDSILVAPMTSGTANPNKRYEVPVEKYYDMSQRNRYVNIFRIRPISKRRVLFSTKQSRVHSSVIRHIVSEYKDFL